MGCRRNHEIRRSHGHFFQYYCIRRELDRVCRNSECRPFSVSRVAFDGRVLTNLQIRHAVSRTNGRSSWCLGCSHATNPRTPGSSIRRLQSSSQGMTYDLLGQRTTNFLTDTSDGICHIFYRHVHNRFPMSFYHHPVWVAGLVDMASVL